MIIGRDWTGAYKALDESAPATCPICSDPLVAERLNPFEQIIRCVRSPEHCQYVRKLDDEEKRQTS